MLLQIFNCEVLPSSLSCGWSLHGSLTECFNDQGFWVFMNFDHAYVFAVQEWSIYKDTKTSLRTS